MQSTRTARRGSEGTVLVIGKRHEWPIPLLTLLASRGYVVVFTDDVTGAPYFVSSGQVRAILLDAARLTPRDALAIRSCREHSASTAVVAVSSGERSPDVIRAAESGATAYLSWPASEEIVVAALQSAPAAASGKGD